jgi:hypothetical protein
MRDLRTKKQASGEAPGVPFWISIKVFGNIRITGTVSELEIEITQAYVRRFDSLLERCRHFDRQT